jgi:transposase InsO family protein
MVDYVKSDHDMSERRACQILSMHRSSYRYRPLDRVSGFAYQAVINQSHAYDYWGYRKIANLVKAGGHQVGREQVRLIRRQEGLQVPQKQQKRRSLGICSLLIDRAEYPGHVWSDDFIFDRTEDGRTLKFLNIVDEYSKVSLALVCKRSMTGTDVKQVLGELIKRWGAPICIRSDNGSEFIAKQVKNWLDKNDIGTHYIDPGSPWQNPFVESLNSIFRITFLNRWMFLSLTEAKQLTANWQAEYNEIRPHGTLGGLSPLQFLRNFRRDNPNFNQMKALET